MLTNKGFIKWANENVVVLISHNELGHDEEVDEKVTGKGARECPLYPGMRCRDHLDIAVETDNSRDDELPVIPFIELCPNSWLIHPDGTPEPIEEKAQFTTKGIRDAAAAAQKKIGKTVAPKGYPALKAHAVAAQKALDDESWKAGLEALAKLQGAVKAPGKGLMAWIKARVELVDEEVEFTFEDARDDTDLTDAKKRAALKPLFDSVNVKVGKAYVPVRDKLAKWLADHPESTGK